MKIVLIAHSLRKQGGLLVGLNFIESLKQTAPQHKYFIIAPKDVGYEDIEIPIGSNFYFYKTKNMVGRTWFDLVTLPKIIKQFCPDIIFGMSAYGLLRPPSPQAIWIQSPYLAYNQKKYPGESLNDRIKLLINKLLLKMALTRTQRMFCQTPVMKERMCKYYNYNPEKVQILPNAVSDFSRYVILPVSIPKVLSMRKPGCLYCLIPSRYYPHKNPEIILKALKSGKQKFSEIFFITTIERDDDPLAPKYLDNVSKNGFNEHIMNVGRIRHEELPSYYKNIDLVIMPSLLESFSVSYIEAMYFGVPILATDLDFAHCICGDAAAYYNPSDVESFSDALIKLKSNPEILEQLRIAGKKQLQKFSYTWDDMVNRALNSLENLVVRESK